MSVKFSSGGVTIHPYYVSRSIRITNSNIEKMIWLDISGEHNFYKMGHSVKRDHYYKITKTMDDVFIAKCTCIGRKYLHFEKIISKNKFKFKMTEPHIKAIKDIGKYDSDEDAIMEIL